MVNYLKYPDSALPNYLQVYKNLLQRIEDGEWSPYEAIPPERELEQIYGTSRTTIRHSMDLLVRRGFLYRKQGRGTFVSLSMLHHDLGLVKGFSDSMLERGHKSGQKNLFLGYINPSNKAQRQLELTDTKDRM